MALADSLKSLREVNLSDLTLDNIGSWPMAIKVVVWALVFGLVCFLGWNYHLKGLREQLLAVRTAETQLREEYRLKAFQVANLEALKAQLAEMEEQFGALLSQLPKDTEVPGLLEDITEKGTDAGLAFDSIALDGKLWLASTGMLGATSGKIRPAALAPATGVIVLPSVCKT